MTSFLKFLQEAANPTIGIFHPLIQVCYTGHRVQLHNEQQWVFNNLKVPIFTASEFWKALQPDKTLKNVRVGPVQALNLRALLHNRKSRDNRIGHQSPKLNSNRQIKYLSVKFLLSNLPKQRNVLLLHTFWPTRSCCSLTFCRSLLIPIPTCNCFSWRDEEALRVGQTTYFKAISWMH